MITYFPKPLNKQVAAISDSLTRTQKGLGIGASGDTHAAIGSGQFVYVKDHSSLAEGLYKSKAAIAQNGALSTSNLTADGTGGLNDLQGQVTALNSNITTINNKITSQLGDLNISFKGTLGGNVIDIMNSANIGITYYRNSNQPTNRPNGCDWGTYILFKNSSTSVGVLYFDFSHFAFNYSIDPTTATSISWKIL